MRKQALMMAVFLGLAASPVLAHGGGPHLKGTVSAIAPDQITVKDAGNHEWMAKITPQTRYIRSKAVGNREDLHQGDRVVFQNGHRNDGWQDFRDNHLVPEMSGPRHPVKGTPVKLRATPQMAWGYTRTELFASSAKPRTVTHVLWSVYVLELRREGWKIVSLDWSIAKQK